MPVFQIGGRSVSDARGACVLLVEVLYGQISYRILVTGSSCRFVNFVGDNVFNPKCSAIGSKSSIE